jgi:hypothetical protein
LIIGESHYIEDSDDYNDSEKGNLFTSIVLQGFLDKKYNINFYRNLGLLFNSENYYEIWENVAFSNAIQTGLEHSKSQPAKEDIVTVIPAFLAFTEKLKT